MDKVYSPENIPNSVATRPKLKYFKTLKVTFASIEVLN